MNDLVVLSAYQTRPLLPARAQGQTQVESSADLGRTPALFSLSAAGVRLPDNQSLTWEAIEEITANDTACYRIQDDRPHKIKFFSETTNRAYSLMPTASAPTMLVAGFPMHRIKGTDPRQDTLSKIKASGPISGRVLDTTMGLGYTAIEAAKTAVHVTTIELDPTVLDVCRHNPWSHELFTTANITRLIGDAYDVVQTLTDGAFHCILHDPPTFSLAGDLYAADFYRELHRILGSKGRLFHYIGNPDSKSGASVTRGVARRLRAAGFKRVIPKPGAFGVLALK